ncbi:MAG: hypothetical protein WB542_14995 [Polaromonas sp.]
MKQSLSTIGFILVVAAACVSCDKLKPPIPELQKPPATSGQASEPEGERKAFAQAAQKELDQLGATITEFKAKAEAANAQTKAKLGEEVGKLEADLRETQQRLTELKSATIESWNQVKESFGKSLEKLKSGIESFRKKTA